MHLKYRRTQVIIPVFDDIFVDEIFWRYNTMAVITKDTIIGQILDIAPETAPIFLSIGMHCLGCPASRGETIEQACMVHGVDADELLAKLNAIAGK